MALTAGRFTGGNLTQPAITNRSVLYARDVHAQGFKQVLHSTTPNGSVTDLHLAEYLSHPAKRLFPTAPDTGLRLPIKPEPKVLWETNLANWVCANEHGATFGDNQDDTAALQAAIDYAAAGGKTVVYLRGIGGGDPNWFVTDCPSHVELRSPGQSLWARQLNPEGDSDVGLVRNHGGRLWALGVKHEGRGVRFLTDGGGQTEILGLFNYPPDIAQDDLRPVFDIVDASFSAAGVREISFGNTYPVKVRERRGDATRTEVGGGWIGWALFRSGNP